VKIVGFDGMQEARNAVDREPAFAGVVRQYPRRWAPWRGCGRQNFARPEVEKLIAVPRAFYTRGPRP